MPACSLDVNEEFLEGELLLYHCGDTRAICLNVTAANIWLFRAPGWNLRSVRFLPRPDEDTRRRGERDTYDSVLAISVG